MSVEQHETATFGEVRRVPGKGYLAYYPRVLPEMVELSSATVGLLADAEAALGRLAGAGRLLRNPHLLTRPYLLREALASTRIEGTRATLAGVPEAEAAGTGYSPDVEEVVNYLAAMEQGLVLLSELPFSLRLVREMHARSATLSSVSSPPRRPAPRERLGRPAPRRIGLVARSYIEM
jgi:hypothetical protein